MDEEYLQKAPKLFCENIKIGSTPEYFVLGLSSGTQMSIYSLTPEHMKRLSLYLEHEIGEYEKKHGKIITEWNPLIKSPLQQLHGPGEGS